jgi:TolB protein
MSAPRRITALAAAGLLVAGALLLAAPPPAARSQAPDVLLNVIAGGARKLNLFMPDFTVTGAPDPTGLSRSLAEVTANDLKFSTLFAVVGGQPALPAGNGEAMKKTWTEAAAAGAHAALHGTLTPRADRLEGEMRLYDLTSPEFRQIATKRFAVVPAEPRRLAHKIADEVVFQFTGEPGDADTKIAYVALRGSSKEIYTMDYDGAAPLPLTANQSINISPRWSPDARSLAFTSYMRGYPYLYRLFAFERRPVQLLAGFLGINSSPAWSPDGRQVALTLSKDGNPEIYVLTLATGAFRRLTTHPSIDTEPTWSPTGREVAFVSDRGGLAQVYVMDAEGANLRRLTQSGFNTQPRWSPKGDAIVFTSRQGNHDLWAVAPDGSALRRLTTGPGDNESAAWAPSGRHLAFQSNRLRGSRVFTMLADGSEQQAIPNAAGDAASPAWSPRLP